MTTARPRAFRLRGDIQREWDDQRAVVAWARLQTRRWPALAFLVGSMNGLRLASAREGVQAKMAGLNPGFPDLQLPVPCHGYHGLFIEMKRAGGRLRDAQRTWLDFLRAQGYCVQVADGAGAALRVLIAYLSSDSSVPDPQDTALTSPAAGRPRARARAVVARTGPRAAAVRRPPATGSPREASDA
jgi:hypothetical protein